MRDTDFIIKQGWMVTKLHLTGAALEIYALIYGYTKDGESWYECNISNISEWLLVSERTVQRHLSTLTDSGYIERQKSKYGRGSKLFLQVSKEVIERIENGDNLSPLKRVTKTTEKGDNLSPFNPKKGDKNDITPIIRILISKDIKVFLSGACAREREEKEFFKIFFFRNAADPAAEVVEFQSWNQANCDNWDSLAQQKKYYFATKWKIKAVRPVPEGWLAMWSRVYNWAVEHEPEMADRLVDGRFSGLRYVDSGEKVCEMHVSADVRDWLLEHRETVLQEVNTYAAGGRGIWKLV